MATASLVLTLVSLSTAGGASYASERYAGRTVSRVELRGSVPEAARDLVDVAVGQPLDPAAVRRSIQQLFALGVFSDIKVDALDDKDESDAGDRVAIAFDLYPAVSVSAVRVTGLEGAIYRWGGRLVNLAREEGVAPGAPLDVEEVDRAAKASENLLRKRGYLWAAVEPELKFASPHAELILHVTQGVQARVHGLDVQGLPGNVERMLRRALGIDSGDAYDREKLEKKLTDATEEWKTKGYYEAVWELREEPVLPGRVHLRLSVSLGPRVEIVLAGASIADKTLEKLVPLKSEATTSADLVEESRANLIEHLRDQGYTQAKVDVSSEESAGSLKLLFRVATGPRVEIESVAIDGLDPDLTREALSRLESRPSGRLRSAPYRERVWESDLKEITRYLKQSGFASVRVTGEVRERPSDHVALVAHVTPGPRAFVAGVEIEGVRELGVEEVLRVSALAPGRVYDASEVVSARERITNLYRDEGFLDAAVDQESLSSSSGTEVTVRFQVREGRRTRVDGVIVSGLDVTQPEVVRRELTVSAGAPLSFRALAESRQKLAATGLFRDIRFDVLPSDADEGAAAVLISLKEGPRTAFAYGFGYEERDLARADVELTRRNLFGLNRTASVFARAGLRGNRFIATYRQPDTFGHDLPLVLSGFREEEARAGYSFIRLGTGVQISKRLSRTRTLFLRYAFERTRLFDVLVDPIEIDRRYRDLRLSLPSVSGVSDTRDDPINPRRGSFATVDLQFSSTLLGSQVAYVKGLAQQFFYIPLPRQMVGAIGLRLGIAQTFRLDRDALIPITERFFAGGASTLRGFALDEASPKDPQGNPVGGNVLSLFNMELRFPIAGNVGGVLFSDSGTVYRRLSVIQLLNWRYNVGLGFRYNTPLGPLRVDYGVKVDRRVGESFGQFHVSIGNAY